MKDRRTPDGVSRGKVKPSPRIKAAPGWNDQNWFGVAGAEPTDLRPDPKAPGKLRCGPLPDIVTVRLATPAHLQEGRWRIQLGTAGLEMTELSIAFLSEEADPREEFRCSLDFPGSLHNAHVEDGSLFWREGRHLLRLDLEAIRAGKGGKTPPPRIARLPQKGPVQFCGNGIALQKIGCHEHYRLEELDWKEEERLAFRHHREACDAPRFSAHDTVSHDGVRYDIHEVQGTGWIEPSERLVAPDGTTAYPGSRANYRAEDRLLLTEACVRLPVRAVGEGWITLFGKAPQCRDMYRFLVDDLDEQDDRIDLFVVKDLREPVPFDGTLNCYRDVPVEGWLQGIRLTIAAGCILSVEAICREAQAHPWLRPDRSTVRVKDFLALPADELDLLP